MKPSAKVFTLLAFVTIGLSLNLTAAYADDDENEDDEDHHSTPIATVPAHEKPSKEIENKAPAEVPASKVEPIEHSEHDELHERYGELERVNLPPLLVKGQSVKTNQTSVNHLPAASTSKTKLADSLISNPTVNIPIDVTLINPNDSTPAEEFFQSASIGLGAMGAGAAVLGGVAVRRTVRLRKDQTTDFIYQ